MNVKTWQQDQFLVGNRYLHKFPGDFWSIDELLPSFDGQYLERAPSWTGHIDLATDYKTTSGAFYSEPNDKFMFVGISEEGASDVVGLMDIEHDDLTVTRVWTMQGTPPGAIGGVHKENVYFIMNSFWFVGDDGDVYAASTPFAGTPYNRYTDGNAIALLPCRDRMFLVNDLDEIYEYNVSTTSFDLFHDTHMLLDVKHALHFREHILLFANHDDGSVIIYQLPNRPPTSLRELVRMPHETGQYLPDSGSAQWGTPFEIHDDRLYFSPGIYWSPSSDCEITPIWIYDGNSVELLENVEAPIVPTAWGLTQWRGRLILYYLNTSAQYLYVLHNGRFVLFNTASYTLPAHADLYSIGGEVWMPTMDSGTEGWTYLDAFATGTFTTSWLDMGRPTVQKHLNTLSAIVSDPAGDLTVKIEYRTESGSWTTAVETANSRHVTAQNIKLDFYMLQIRITFTEGTGGTETTKLHSLGATYSYGR